MSLPLRPVLALLAALALPGQGFAADIAIKPWRGPDGPISVITIAGHLDDGDEDRFAEIARSVDRGLVVLDGPGGSATAGIEIGMAIREKHFDTLVREGATCASACAIAWLAGTARLMADGARIGFHSIYDKDSGRRSASGNAAVAAYAEELGLEGPAIDYLTSAPPQDMRWLSFSDADNYGIKVTPFATLKPHGAAADLKRRTSRLGSPRPSAANPVPNAAPHAGPSSRASPA